MLSFQPNTYSRPATADLIVHCTGQGDEIKKKKLYIYCGVFNWLYSTDIM